MAYGTVWKPHAAEQCRLDAEKRAGEAPLGYLYRFEWQGYAAPLNEYDEPVGGANYQLELYAYPIEKRTSCGWTLGIWSGANRKFVGENHKKQFASPTVREALGHFVARRKAEIRIHKAKLANAERALAAGLNEDKYDLPIFAR